MVSLGIIYFKYKASIYFILA